MTTLRATLALIESAVLVPLYRGSDGRLGLVFIRRSPFGQHGGQIAFPGGRREPNDPDLLATALREAEEEIGLERRSVDILAAREPGYFVDETGGSAPPPRAAALSRS